MRFHLLDRIETLTDDRIVAVKAVTQAEEYLSDHFPRFPVLPGVLMLEAATQAASWLAYKRTDFAFTVAVLKSARNLRYGNFVAPGHSLRVAVDYDKVTEAGHAFKIEGSVENAGEMRTAVTGKIELACFNMEGRTADGAEVDRRLRISIGKRWAALTLSRSEAALKI